MKYKINDFSPKEAWLIFRVDFQIKDQPVDTYMVMELPSGTIITFETVETELSQSKANMLLQQAKKETGYLPRRLILAKGDPAETFLNESATNLHVQFESVSAVYLEELVTPLKQSFGEHFYSPSTIGYANLNDNTDEFDNESAKYFIPDSYDLCSCASGKKYKFCCKKILREITEAMVAAEDGHFSEAIKWIEKAKSIAGETSEVLCREAIVYSYFDQEKSETILNKCLEMNPKHPRAHYIHGLTLKEQGKFDGAIKAYETAIAYYPASDHYHLNETYNNLGTTFHAMGDLVKAKSAWEKALLFLPSDKTARMNLEHFIYKRPIG